MPQELVFRGRLDTYTGYGQQFCPLIQFFIHCGFDVKVRGTGIDESFTAVVPEEIKERNVGDEPQDNEWEFQMLPLVHPVTPGKNVIYFTMWETDVIGQQAVAILNTCKCIIVPCQWNKATFEKCGVMVPIRVVPLGIDKDAFRYRLPPPRNVCVFGAAGRMGHGITRKGVPMVIEAFQEAFPKSVRDVRLNVKCFADCISNGHIKQSKDRRIVVTPEFMDEQRLGEWLGSLSAFVSAASGEGWGLWQHQALSTGRPVIGCEYGGMAEFLTGNNSFPLKYTEVDAGEHHAGYGKWAKPDFDSLVRQMQFVYENRLEAESRGLRGARDVQHLTHENTALAVMDVMREFGVLDKTKAAPKVTIGVHSGDCGDVIYALPTIRALGITELYLSESPHTRLKMRPDLAHNLASLLLHQPYLKSVKYGNPSCEHIDLNLFRACWDEIDPPPRDLRVSIADVHLQTFGLDAEERDNPWLSVDHPTITKPVVINRTARYQNSDFPWKRIADHFRDVAVFVGTDEEHRDFVKVTGWALPHQKTRTFLEVARVIAGCRLFIGNQSSPYAIAEGMKKRAILEVWDTDPNCLFFREGVSHVWKAGDLILPAIEAL